MTEEQWEGLLNHLSEGGSVREFGRKLGQEDTVRQQVARRIREDDEFRRQYARAKEFGIEMRLDRLASMIAESDPQFVAKTRLQWDHERWEASKLNAKKYGDKIHQEVSGEVTHKAVILSKEEYDAI